MATKTVERFALFDTRNSGVVVPGRLYKTLSAARRAADKLDNEYGAVRYAVRRISVAITEEA